METLAEAVERTGWVVHAWVLMKTHYHLLLETPEANLVVGGWLHAHYPLTRKWIASRLELGHPSRVGVAIAGFRSPLEDDRGRKVELEQIVRLFG